MQRFHAAITAISLWFARAGGFMLLAAALIITFEIAARKLFLLPFNVGTELSTYALATGASWSFSYALLRRAHVRVDVLRKPFPPAGRCLLDILALLSLTALAFVLSYFAWQTAATSWIFEARENTPLATPLAIPQGLWFLGISWFALVAAEQSVMAVLAFARGHVAEAIQIAGPVGVAEELEEVSSSSILLNQTRK